MSGTAHQKALDQALHEWATTDDKDRYKSAKLSKDRLGLSYGVHLHCPACNGNHRFSARDVEHLVAVLHGSWADSCHDAPTDDGADSPEDVLTGQCFLEMATTWAHDSELYLEHAKGAVEARQKAELV